MPEQDPITVVYTELQPVLADISRTSLTQLAEQLNAANRVFVTGEGRSGLMGKAFAMRLMHLGLKSYVVGESTTPSVGEQDTVVAISGSGATAGTMLTAERAAAAGARIEAVTTDPAAELAKLADGLLVLPAATKYRKDHESGTVQPLSSLFDQACHLALDAVCLLLAEQNRIGTATARAAHSNTE